MVGILDIIGVLNPIIDRVFPDPKDKLELQEKLATLADQESEREHQEVMGQIGTNNIEANNQSLFVAGWRPFVGWVCGVALSYSFVLEPFAEFVARRQGYVGDFPVLDMGNLMTLMMGMLGMGYLRTKEKLSDVPDSLQKEASVVVTKPKKKILGVNWPF
jgi:hypothetical protein